MITVFGSINLDLIGSVDRLPRPGETVLGRSFATAPGGKGANQALAAARAGGAVRMVGVVGWDDFAQPALSFLRASSVDLSGIRQAFTQTGVALILVDQAGENVIAVLPGANDNLGVNDAAALEFTSEDILLVQLEVDDDAIGVAAQKAREAGARVLLNFAPFRAKALDLLRHGTHLVVNESECELIAAALEANGSSAADQAAALAGRLGLCVIVTLGKDGVVAVQEGRVVRAAALPVQAVDTVGAGDTFCGYLAAAFSEGLPLADALSLAAAAASIACTKSGAQPAIPIRAEVDAVSR